MVKIPEAVMFCPFCEKAFYSYEVPGIEKQTRIKMMLGRLGEHIKQHTKPGKPYPPWFDGEMPKRPTKTTDGEVVKRRTPWSEGEAK